MYHTDVLGIHRMPMFSAVMLGGGGGGGGVGSAQHTS